MTPQTWKLIHHFNPSEFACRCGCGRGPGAMDAEFISMLDRARGLSGVPFRITSGFRCTAHNKAVGGVRGSSHLKGLAADIYVPSDASRFDMVQSLMAMGLFRLGIGENFIHADADPDKPSPSMWRYEGGRAAW